MADALRGQGFHTEADQLYQDMFVVQRTNVRNIADMLKNLCLAGRWHEAQKFLYRVALRHEPARWDSDVIIHAGWLMAGGTKQLSDADKKNHLMIKAFQYIDYALYTRPRTARVWRQTRWDIFEQEIPFPENTTQLHTSFAVKLTNEQISKYENLNVQRARIALAWRKWLISQIVQAQPQATSPINSVNEYLSPFLDQYIKLVQTILVDESTWVQEERFTDALRYFTYSQYAQDAYNLWHKVNETFFGDMNDPRINTITFKGRMQLELYILVALLAARMLAQAQRFDPLAYMTSIVCERLDQHRIKWSETYRFPRGANASRDGEQHFTFSPIVFRYQYASLKAWNAYALFMRDGDLIAESVSQTIRQKQAYSNRMSFDLRLNREASLEIARKQIIEARKECAVHPLVMFVRAQLLAQSSLFAPAIQELKSLLDIIEPFDPKSDIGFASGDTIAPSATTSEQRASRYHLERIAGRQQFHQIVNPVVIYELMAEYAAAMRQPAQSVAYLNAAVRRSPFNDRDFGLFEKLGMQFSHLERYPSAMAIAHAMKMPREALPPAGLLGIYRLAPEILEAEVLTRQGLYSQARLLSRRLANHFRLFLSMGVDQGNLAGENKSAKDNYRIDFDQHTADFVIAYTNKTLSENQKILKTFGEEFSKIIHIDDDFINIDSFSDGLARVIRSIASRYALTDELPELDQNKGIKFLTVFEDIADVDLQQFRLTDTNASTNFYYDPAQPRYDDRNALYYALNHLAERSLYIQNKHKLMQLLTANVHRSNDFHLAEYMRVVIYHGRQARSTLIYLADLLNILAYNRAMLGLARTRFGFVDAAIGVYILTYLYTTCDIAEDRVIIARKLAQVCDTYAWITFVNMRPMLSAMNQIEATQAGNQTESNLSRNILLKLDQVEKVLREGLRYDPSRAIIRYHLAYMYLASIEFLLNLDHSTDAIIGMSAPEISVLVDEYLEHAEAEIAHARQSDQSKRLGYKLDQVSKWYARMCRQHARLNGRYKESSEG